MGDFNAKVSNPASTSTEYTVNIGLGTINEWGESLIETCHL